MSGFDENPFGEPVFEDPFKVNQFFFLMFHHIFVTWSLILSHKLVTHL